MNEKWSDKIGLFDFMEKNIPMGFQKFARLLSGDFNGQYSPSSA